MAAQAYVLVERGRWEKMKGINTNEQKTIEKPMAIQIDRERQEEHQSSDNITELLPKGYRSRAKVILRYIKKYISPSFRMVYPDKTVGSNVIDLLRYVLSQKPTASQPLDIANFVNLLQELSAPTSVYRIHQAINLNKRVINSKNWLSL